MPVGSIVVTGAGGAVGRRVAAALGADVVAVADLAAIRGAAPPSNGAGATAMVHLAWSVGPGRAKEPTRADVDATRQILDAAAEAGVTSLVHLSTATAYGAWMDNPIPLTEEEPLRPNPGVADAVHHAEAERLVAAWADDHPDCAVAVLRPATVVGPGIDSSLSRALGGQPAFRSGARDPARQFVHVDDLASAVAHAVHHKLDGVFNVAADGWIAGDVVRGLSAARPSVPVPGRLAPSATRLAWSLHLSNLPPALQPLIEHPWVVANDKLRAAGWIPSYTNEEAIVAGRPGGRWREMGVARRQQVVLGLGGLLVAGGTAGAIAAAAALRRRAAAR